MKINKAHVIIGAASLVTITGAILLYRQYKKLMNYCIGLNRIKVNGINQTSANLDLFLNFRNKSDVAINIISQESAIN